MKSAFIISAASSGSGKTLITLGLLEALRRRGIAVQPFKAGPDYIDPGHHSALLGVPSYNLDTWMMGVDGVKRTFSRHAKDVSVIEGVMGLYDGRDGVNEEGSTAHLSKVLGVPVVLVVDAQKMARSSGAVIKGFEEYDKNVKLRWVIFNRVGSPRHFDILKSSIPKGSKVRALGYIPRDEALEMPSRHLGLFAPKDLKKGAWVKVIDRAASIIEANLGLDGLIKESTLKLKSPMEKGAGSEEIKIAVAFDEAFSFYYQENLEILKEHGAEMIFFSPLRDKRLPGGIGGIYLGGGYPELYAKRLEANAALRGEVKKMAREGLPIFAECGGLMYLGDSIEVKGKCFAMAGVFPFSSRMFPKRKALGYREVEASGGPFKCEGALRGHEFHYSELMDRPKAVSRCFKVNGGGREGYFFRNTLATYIHLHFASNKMFAARFVESCKKYGRKGKR